MEFDVLNEILTGTVAQLFTNRQSHNNFFKTSSEMGEDKLDIPINKMPSDSAPQYSGLDKNVQDWLQIEAKCKLAESMSKLGLDTIKV